MEAAFDTLAYTRRLKAAGFSEEQAEAQTEALHVAFREGAVARGDVATKADLEAAKADLEAKLAGLATKADLAGLATKAELAGLATKAELAGLATKAELAGLATKAELAALEVRVTNRLYAAVFAGFALNAGLVIAVVKLL